MATTSRFKRAAGPAIFLVTFAIFYFSPNYQLADSNYSMLLSQNLLYHRSFALDSYKFDGITHTPGVGYVSAAPPYQLELVDGHVYYKFPPGSSILSLPYVALMNVFHLSASNADGTYNPVGEIKIQLGLATLLMASLATLFFYTSRLVLPTGWSVLVAVGGAFGTQIWSTASRALWSDTWGIFLLGFVILILLGHEIDKRPIRPILLATLLSWMYFVRPTNSISVVAITIYMLVFHRRSFWTYAGTGALWLAAFVIYSWSHYKQLLPPYYQANRLTFSNFGVALAGNLFSPSRGLFIFVPVLIFVFYLLFRYRKDLPAPRLVVVALAIIIAHVIAISAFPHWWGGYSFGPRLSTGLVPWFVLLGMLGISAMRSGQNTRSPALSLKGVRVELAVGMVLLSLAVWINFRGANSLATWLWNSRPVSIDEHPERLWDWKHPQFLARQKDYQ
jgi:hypothetical protein